MKLKTYTVRTTEWDRYRWLNSALGPCPITRGFLRTGVPVNGVCASGFLYRNKNYKFARRVVNWVRALDFGTPVRPITFKIKLPV